MTRFIAIAAILGSLIGAAFSVSAARADEVPAMRLHPGPIVLDGARIETCHTPGQNCRAWVIGHIQRARSRVLLMGFAFTDAGIAEALLQAHRRGIVVHLVLDRSNTADRWSQAPAMAAAGVPTWIDPTVRIHHNKMLLIDGDTVITGSYNWSWAANASNAENLHAIHGSRPLLERNLAYFHERLGHASIFGSAPLGSPWR